MNLNITNSMIGLDQTDQADQSDQIDPTNMILLIPITILIRLSNDFDQVYHFVLLLIKLITLFCTSFFFALLGQFDKIIMYINLIMLIMFINLIFLITLFVLTILITWRTLINLVSLIK